MTEVQAGLREGSVVTIPDVSESIDSQDVWTELRRELEDVGINEAVVEENREFISSWVKAAISGGQLDEAPLENQPFSSSKPRKPSVAAFSYSGYGSADETETLAPSVMSLNIANDEFEEELRKQRLDRPLDDILDYMVTQQVAEPSVKLRKKSDPGRLLQKLFQKNTAIIQAASDGDVDKVAKLIGLGVDVNARDRWGWSALSMCGYGGHKTIARLLLDHGADLDNVDVDDDTPTGLATQRGHTDLVIMFDEERARRDLRLREMCQEKPRRLVILPRR
jgi:hypothetical protein